MSLAGQAACSKNTLPTPARRLHVLVIDEEFPFPPNSGKRIRSWNLLRRLAQRHDVELLCFGPVEEGALEAARGANIRLHAVEEQITKKGASLYFDLFLNLFSQYPYSVVKHYTPKFRAAMADLLATGKFDLIHCEWSPYARYIHNAHGLPASIAAHNVESQIWHRRAQHASGLPARIFFGIQAAKMERFERSVLGQARAITAVSSNDAATLSGWGLPGVSVVDNGVDVDAIRPADPLLHERDDELLFLASLDWFPNQDALWYFVREILPLIEDAAPSCRLRVVGRRLPQDQIERLRSTSGVEFVGEVDDVRAQYDPAAVVVVPLRIGGGSRLKILEALAAGKAVVSTTIGAEGLEVTHGEHLLIADTPRDFADSIVRLMRDRGLRQSLGKAGRQLVERRYSWDGLAERMDTIWHETAEVRR